MTEWLQGYLPHAVSGHASLITEEPFDRGAGAAVKHLGTNAIPTLLRLLATRDIPMRTMAIELAQRQDFIRISCTRPDDLIREAVLGLQELGPEVRWAVPQLMQIYEQHPNVMSRQIVPALLAGIGPQAEQAVPLLVQATTDIDPFVRNNSVYALGRIGAEPALVVPALTKCLEDPADYVRANATQALAAFGTNARPAVPALLKLLARERPIPSVVSRSSLRKFTIVWEADPAGSAMNVNGPIDVMDPATNALKAIDPAAAAEASLR